MSDKTGYSTTINLRWSLQSLHAQCVSGSFEITGVHSPPTSQALWCDYCTHVHRDDDAQTIYRAALVHSRYRVITRCDQAALKSDYHKRKSGKLTCPADVRASSIAQSVDKLADQRGDLPASIKMKAGITLGMTSRLRDRHAHLLFSTTGMGQWGVILKK